VKNSTNGNITLTGDLSTTVTNGIAFFNRVIVLGPSNAEFTLQVTSNPPLIPFTSPFAARITAGGTQNYFIRL
jgi:hypothetical protein